MAENHVFHADAAIISRLGSQLVAKQETALTELVKNAYDADALEVIVAFEARSTPAAAIRITDNGVGMSRDDLLNRFLRLASESKAREPKSEKYGRTRAGRKGIGRFSAQRLGTRMTLTTYKVGEPQGWRLSADWSLFSAGKRLEDVSVILEEIEPTKVGTTLLIENLNDNWTPSQIRSCWRNVLALQQPFPIAPVQKGNGPTSHDVKSADPGFKVSFVDNGGIFDDSTVIADMQTEILDYLPVIIELNVDETGRATWAITKNEFGDLRAWRAIHHGASDNPKPPAYEALRNVHMRAYHVVLDSALLPSVAFTRIRDVMRREGGVRLYRNGFRVTPYGEADDDWLGLDQVYARRDYLAPVANRNFFGLIEVRDPEGTFFEEHTSREGLIETAAFLELRGLVSSVLLTAATEIQADRGRKTRTKSPSPNPVKSAAIGDARAAARAAREAAERATNALGTPAMLEALERAKDAERLVVAAEQDITTERVQLADEAAMMRLLSSIGMTTAEFSHETGMSFEAFRLDLDRVFEVARAARDGDAAFDLQAKRASEALSRLDTLTAYLNTTVASRAMREIHPVSLSRAVEDFARGLRAHALTQSTTMTIDTPPFDALYTTPMHEAEVASVMLNFHTNAIKAMKRSDGPRKILIIADRLDETKEVRVRFCDTGDGIPAHVRQRIFEPFFTTRAAPEARATEMEHARGTGLGLWIVDQIAKNAGGQVEVGDPPTGYTTCLELRLPAEVEQ